MFTKRTNSHRETWMIEIATNHKEGIQTHIPTGLGVFEEAERR